MISTNLDYSPLWAILWCGRGIIHPEVFNCSRHPDTAGNMEVLVPLAAAGGARNAWLSPACQVRSVVFRPMTDAGRTDATHRVEYCSGR